MLDDVPRTLLMTDPGMASYGFMSGSAPGGRHFYGADRFAAFYREFLRRDWQGRVEMIPFSPPARRDELELFHTAEYLDRLAALAAEGQGAYDHGPTPVEPGIEHAAAAVAGTVLHASRELESRDARTAFVPISGFHHGAAEFTRDYCLVNDPAILLSRWLVEAPDERVAYVDVDVHFGNGVFERFRSDPRVLLVDLHQDATTFWYAEENDTEIGEIREATALSIPLEPGTADASFLDTWRDAAALVRRFRPRRILCLAGADMLRGDGLGGLECGAETLCAVVAELRGIVEEHPRGRLLALGGGGYALENLGPAWCDVLATLCGLEAPMKPETGGRR